MVVIPKHTVVLISETGSHFLWTWERDRAAAEARLVDTAALDHRFSQLVSRTNGVSTSWPLSKRSRL